MYQHLNTRRVFVFAAILAIVIIIILQHYDAEGAPANAQVERFPGYNGTLPLNHYAGYITVGDEQNKRHLYYYFATSERNPATDPVVLWLNGGPGCSGLNAVLYLLGPFKFNTRDGYHASFPKLQLNPYSWTKVSSIIFVDSPAGTGFSYADTIDAYKMDDDKATLDAYTFILKWFEEYPEFLLNPFYVAGSSYGGVYVPIVAEGIVNGIEAGVKPILNFKGYTVGNGYTNMDFDFNSRVSFAYGMGLIPRELYHDLKDTCNGDYWNPNNSDCLFNLEVYRQAIDGINSNHILCLPCHYEMRTEEVVSSQGSFEGSNQLKEIKEPVVVRKSMLPSIVISPDAGGHLLPSHLNEDVYCYDYNERPRILLNSQDAREYIHAQPEHITGEWLRCKDLEYKFGSINVIPYHKNVTSKGYRAFIYSGDHDMGAPFYGTEAWIKSLGYDIIEKWRPWFFGDQIAGYTRTYDHNLMYATFKGAGHTVPEYKPREALAAYTRWLDEEPL